MNLNVSDENEMMANGQKENGKDGCFCLHKKKVHGSRQDQRSKSQKKQNYNEPGDHILSREACVIRTLIIDASSIRLYFFFCCYWLLLLLCMYGCVCVRQGVWLSVGFDWKEGAFI